MSGFGKMELHGKLADQRLSSHLLHFLSTLPTISSGCSSIAWIRREPPRPKFCWYGNLYLLCDSPLTKFVAGTRLPFGWNPLWHQVGLLTPEYAAGWAHCPAKYVSQCHLHNLTYKLARMECHITATQIWPIHRWFNTLAVDEITSREEGRRLKWLELNGKSLHCVVAHFFH